MTEKTMSGKAATFGGRMMVPVANQILKQFAEIFATRVQESESELPGAPGDTTQRPDEDGSAAPETSLNALGLLWAVVKDALGRLFGKKGS